MNHVTLQHTREGTYWPDLEEAEDRGESLLVYSSQIDPTKEYLVTGRDKRTGRVQEMRDEEGEEYWLVWNPGLGRYYVRSKAPEKPFRTPQHMTGHRAFYHEGSKTIIWMVPRNGSCTVLASLLNAKGKKPNVYQPALVWTCAGQDECFFDERGDKLSRPEKWIEYKHVIVYQDPILRAVRHMNYILSVNRPQFFTFFSDDPDKMNDVGVFMDTYLAVAEMNKRNGKGYYEQHMMPQMFYHRTLPVTPDIIVDLEDLEPFIRTELGIEPKMANVENAVGLSIRDFTRKREAWAEKVYKEDRLIETRFKDRWWKKG